jgi:D-threonate/D-erythronate kinase
MPEPEKSAAPRIGLLADDLTGACDAGVQFAQRGFSTLVRIAPPLTKPRAFDLVVLTTHSRNDSPATAGAKVREACQSLTADGREVIYKKIDSTLRGNLGYELEAVMEECGFFLALVAPAFPAMGRRLEAGSLRVADSERSDSVNLPELLRQQAVSRVVHLGRAAWANGSAALCERLDQLPEKTIVVLDSLNDGDLEAIASAWIGLRGRALLVGSAGLAAAAAKIMAEKFQNALLPAATIHSKTTSGSVILVMGSTHPVTKSQIDFLLRNQPVAHLKLPGDRGPKALEALKGGRHLLLTVEPERGDEGSLKEFLGVLEHSAVRGITLSGGDTAFAILCALGASGIKLEREVLPGIPFGYIVGGRADGLAVVTKAGGFGNEDTLAAITEFLVRPTRNR